MRLRAFSGHWKEPRGQTHGGRPSALRRDPENRCGQIGSAFDGPQSTHTAICVRTTIELPDPLFQRAKLAAVQRGVTLKELITDALESALNQPLPSARRMTWTSLAEDPRTVWIGEVPPSHEGFFREHVSGQESSPNLWTDAWLAALAVASEQRLTTFDAGFCHFSPGRLNLELPS